MPRPLVERREIGRESMRHRRLRFFKAGDRNPGVKGWRAVRDAKSLPFSRKLAKNSIHRASSAPAPERSRVSSPNLVHATVAK